jgi:hypothetical protein
MDKLLEKIDFMSTELPYTLCFILHDREKTLNKRSIYLNVFL